MITGAQCSTNGMFDTNNGHWSMHYFLTLWKCDHVHGACLYVHSLKELLSAAAAKILKWITLQCLHGMYRICLLAV